MSSAQPAALGDDRVRHIRTGDLGTVNRVVTPAGAAVAWVLVRWDDDGPGMRDAQGLSRVAPNLLEQA
jgi:hypothetical protein